MLGFFLIIVVLLLLFGGGGGYYGFTSGNAHYGYGGSGLALICIVLLVFLLLR